MTDSSSRTTPLNTTPPDTTASGRRRMVLAGGAIGVAAVAGGLWWRSARDASGPASELWALELPAPQGGALQLAAWRGKRVVINFWATWCTPCLEEMPMLDQFQQQPQGGLPVIGLALDRMAQVQRFLRRLPVQFPIGVLETGGLDLTRRLGNSNGGLPFSLLMNEDGSIAAVKTGQLLAADLKNWSGV